MRADTLTSVVEYEVFYSNIVQFSKLDVHWLESTVIHTRRDISPTYEQKKGTEVIIETKKKVSGTTGSHSSIRKIASESAATIGFVKRRTPRFLKKKKRTTLTILDDIFVEACYIKLTVRVTFI
jgi:hypothetical protein